MATTTGTNLGWHALDDLTWNYPMKHLFLLAIVAMITVKMSFTHFYSSSCQGNIPSSKSCSLLVQTIIGKMESNRDKDYWRKFVTKLYFVSVAKAKDPSIKVKMHQTFFLKFYYYLPYICWMYVIYLTSFFFLKSPWWLVWIFCAPTPLTWETKLRKCNIRKYFVAHEKVWKTFHGPSIYA